MFESNYGCVLSYKQCWSRFQGSKSCRPDKDRAGILAPEFQRFVDGTGLWGGIGESCRSEIALAGLSWTSLSLDIIV
jgi:hypothetical protein